MYPLCPLVTLKSQCKTFALNSIKCLALGTSRILRKDCCE